MILIPISHMGNMVLANPHCADEILYLSHSFSLSLLLYVFSLYFLSLFLILSLSHTQTLTHQLSRFDTRRMDEITNRSNNSKFVKYSTRQNGFINQNLPLSAVLVALNRQCSLWIDEPHSYIPMAGLNFKLKSIFPFSISYACPYKISLYIARSLCLPLFFSPFLSRSLSLSNKISCHVFRMALFNCARRSLLFEMLPNFERNLNRPECCSANQTYCRSQ